LRLGDLGHQTNLEEKKKLERGGEQFSQRERDKNPEFRMGKLKREGALHIKETVEKRENS